MEGNLGPHAPTPAPAPIDGKELIPVSSAAPHHGYGLRSREGANWGDQAGLGIRGKPDPGAPIRPPILSEADREAEEDVTTMDQPGRVESGTGPTSIKLPEDMAAGTRPRSEAGGDVEAGQFRP